MTFKEAIELLKLGELHKVLKTLYTSDEVEIIKENATCIFLCKGEMFIQQENKEIVPPRMVTLKFAELLAECLDIEFCEV